MNVMASILEILPSFTGALCWPNLLCVFCQAQVASRWGEFVSNEPTTGGEFFFSGGGKNYINQQLTISRGV